MQPHRSVPPCATRSSAPTCPRRAPAGSAADRQHPGQHPHRDHRADLLRAARRAGEPVASQPQRSHRQPARGARSAPGRTGWCAARAQPADRHRHRDRRPVAPSAVTASHRPVWTTVSVPAHSPYRLTSSGSITRSARTGPAAAQRDRRRRPRPAGRRARPAPGSPTGRRGRARHGRGQRRPRPRPVGRVGPDAHLRPPGSGTSTFSNTSAMTPAVVAPPSTASRVSSSRCASTGSARRCTSLGTTYSRPCAAAYACAQRTSARSAAGAGPQP